MGKAYLVLEDGSVYPGQSLGAAGCCKGELVFTTGMCGYVETLTDPRYAGQIVLQSFPLIGNYGVNEQDFEGEPVMKGYVVRECCDTPSNFRSQYDLNSYLKSRGIPGICGVDTRAIVRKLRDKGTMNAMICAEPPQNFDILAAYSADEEIMKLLPAESAIYPAQGEERFHVALMDFGCKRSTIEALRALGCKLTRVPASTTAQEILSLGADGVLLSNGAGDPMLRKGAISTIAALMGKLPMLGLGLGHQLMALAQGARTEKLHYGHRGANQPVRDMKGARTYITAQNHGYVVASESVVIGEIRYQNANDMSCEGIDYPSLNAFGVQFDADAQTAALIYGRFISAMGGEDICR